MSFFVPIESILIAFVWQYAPNQQFKIIASFLGVIIAAMAILSDLRLRQYYEAFRDRAIDIENRTSEKMYLFTSSKEKLNNTWTISHRYIYQGVFVGLTLILIASNFFETIKIEKQIAELKCYTSKERSCVIN